MNISHTTISGAFVIETPKIQDQRGCFSRLFCDEQLLPVLDTRKIVQINNSLTKKTGAIRGMHYQHPPSAEMKLIRCLKGKVFDVAVDLRKGSETFMQWHAEELSPDNNKLFIIPEGCAHGFQVLEKDSELLYLHTNDYQPQHEGGIRFDDPTINIQWPLTPTDISERDQSHILINSNFRGIIL